MKISDIFKKIQYYKIYNFDYNNKKSGLVFQQFEGEKSQEIDSIIIKDNIIFLISEYQGQNYNEAKKKIKNFFLNLKYINNQEKLNLVVPDSKSTKGKSAKEKVIKIKEYVKGKSKKYKIYITKIFFCPKVKIPREDTEKLNKDEKILDKSHYDYFKYGFDKVEKFYTERELLYFLGIKKIYINQNKKTGSINIPEPTRPFPIFEVQSRNKVKIFSCIATVRDIIEFVRVFRISEEYEKSGFQRMVNGNRLRYISKNYLKKNDIFPDSIILSLNPDLYKDESDFVNNKQIKFYKEFGSLIVIDGQHRLLAHLIKAERDIDNFIFLNIIFFKKSKDPFFEMGKTFYTINKEQKRLSPLLSLKLLSKIEPNSTKSIWYKLFEKLNKLQQKDNFFYNKISFEEKELRSKEDKNKPNISSLINYSGVIRVSNGTEIKSNKNKIKILGIKDIVSGRKLENSHSNLIRKYFFIIKELIKKQELTARDIGSLIRLILHLLNHDKTKQYIENLSKDEPLDTITKTEIKKFLKCIPFKKFNKVSYPPNGWAPMEGFLVGNIHKKFGNFGISKILSKKGIIEFNKIIK